MKNLYFLVLIIIVFPGFAGNPLPTDKNATTETVNLYKNLIKLQHKGIMFGHQDDLAYGQNWMYEDGRSDVKDVVGDYPAVYGWDVGHIEIGEAKNLDAVPFAQMQRWIREIYGRGGVSTISWHMRNPLTGGDSWDTSSKKVVESILPGGKKHDIFKQYLNNLAKFLLGLKTENGTYIPVLFRPFHEHTGSWFWWGKNLCTVEDYKALWRFTLNYLQYEKNIHHILYIYSTDRFKNEEEYLERYPGDDIIDILGFDLYDRGPDYPKVLENCAEKVTQLAKEKNKIATVSETGGPVAENTTWWTETLLNTLQPFDLSYVLVWRNPYGGKGAGHGAFAPYKGSADSNNFVKFYNDPKTFFQKEVTKRELYQ